MRDSPWLPSGRLAVALTLIWHLIGSNDTITMSAWLMASLGGRSRRGTCVWRVSSRWEHTWARLGAPSAPKSILTPLKRLSASMALQCNYPVGNDISTQFLPASLLLGSNPLPQASRRRLCGPRWPQSSCYLIPQGCELERLWAKLVTEQLLSDLRGCAEPVPQSDWMWCSSASCRDNWLLSSGRRGYPLKASGLND